MSDAHCELSVHGWPKPSCGASGGESITTASTICIAASIVPQLDVVGSHSRLDAAQPASTHRNPRATLIIEAKLHQRSRRAARNFAHEIYGARFTSQCRRALAASA